VSNNLCAQLRELLEVDKMKAFELAARSALAEARSLDLMLAALVVFSIPFIMLMRMLNIFTDQLAGNMLIGTLFAVAFFAMPVMMIHVATANCDKE